MTAMILYYADHIIKNCGADILDVNTDLIKGI